VDFINKRLLCVDLSNQAYKASAAHPTLSSDGVFTGGLYGFMMAVAKAIGDTGATSIVLCTDSKPYRRSLLYPEYKALRKDTKDKELADRVALTITQIHELVKVTGWPIWSVPEFESDDLIAHAVTLYRHRYDKIIAMSNDSDLYQLFQWPHFQLYKGKKGLYLREDFDAEWKGLSPDKLVMVLSMTGTHNEIAGIFGIGPVTAIHAMNNTNHLGAILITHREIVERNMKLIQLPHPEFPTDVQKPLPTCRYDERALQRFCARYEIQLQRWQSENFEKLK
jgi:DNA polymerase I